MTVTFAKRAIGKMVCLATKKDKFKILADPTSKGREGEPLLQMEGKVKFFTDTEILSFKHAFNDSILHLGHKSRDFVEDCAALLEALLDEPVPATAQGVLHALESVPTLMGLTPKQKEQKKKNELEQALEDVEPLLARLEELERLEGARQSYCEAELEKAKAAKKEGEVPSWKKIPGHEILSMMVDVKFYRNEVYGLRASLQRERDAQAELQRQLEEAQGQVGELLELMEQEEEEEPEPPPPKLKPKSMLSLKRKKK